MSTKRRASPDGGSLVTLRLELRREIPADSVVHSQMQACAARGIRFFTLASAGDSIETRSRLYDLVREGVIDDPSNDGTFMTLAEFSTQLFEPYYWRWADGQFIAAAGSEWIGLTSTQVHDTGAEFGVTVVSRAHRGQGVARALKLLALRFLRDAGVVSVTTRNSPLNEPILRLNGRLGFEPEG